MVHIIAVAEHLLNPKGSEYSVTFVWRLVTTLIQKVGPRLGEHLDLLRKAVLSKLQGAKTLSVVQSLIMVYAQLVHSQMEAVLMFLSNVPGPIGNSALHFVMSEWVSKQPNFYGSYESKVSIAALAKLLQHGVNSNDSRLTEITVKDDQVFSEGRSTRSSRQNKPEQWTEVPLLAKLLTLLINEIKNVMEDVLLLWIKLPWFYIILFLLRLLILMNLTMMMSGKVIVRTVMPLSTPVLTSRVWTSANCLLLLRTTLTMLKRKILTARLTLSTRWISSSTCSTS